MGKKAKRAEKQIHELWDEVRSIIVQARGGETAEPYEIGILNGIVAAGAIADGRLEKEGVDINTLANNVLCATREEVKGADPLHDILVAFIRRDNE